MGSSVAWGIAGFGWVASDYMMPAIRAVGDRLVGVADPSSSARDAAASRGVRSVPSVEELVADPAIEAIYVATPNHLHRSAVEVAAAAGKAVLCEKPIAMTFTDAKAAVDACGRAGVLYGTAFDQRHHAAHRAMRTAVQVGRIGTVTAVRIVYACWLGPAWTSGHDGGDNWRADPQRAGGGAFMDLAPHGLDLVDVLLGEPVAHGTAILQRRVHAYGVDDGAIFVGATRTGILVSMHVAYNVPDVLPRRRLEITGSAGLLVATNTMGQAPGGDVVIIDGSTGISEALVVPNADEPPFHAQVRAFGAALRGGPSTFDGARDLAAMRLLEAAYRTPKCV